MAAPTKLGAAIPSAGGGVVYPASVRGSWVTVSDDLTTGAETDALLRPFIYAGTGVHPAEVTGAGVRVRFRCRYPQGSTATEHPVINVYGVDGAAPTSAGVFSETANAAGEPTNTACLLAEDVTITLAPSTDLRVGDFKVSEWTDAIDVEGHQWVLPLTKTVAAVSAGAVILEARVTN